MTPFDMGLTASDGQRQAVYCQKSLRSIPRRRTVFEGTYDGRSVIIKCFEDYWGWYRCGREKRGLERLIACGLAAPKVLLVGKDSAGRHILVIEKIANAVDVLTAVQSAPSEDAAREMLLAVFRYVARMHQAGVVQNDLHLGNFLAAESKIYAIDPACMKFYEKPIYLSNNCRQLAMLLAALPQKFLVWEVEFMQAYCDARGQAYSPEMLNNVRFLTARRRKQHLPHALKKTLRNSKQFFVLNVPPYHGVFYKEAFDESSARLMIERVKSATVSDNLSRIVDLNGQEYRMACYEPKNRILALWYRLAGSPARRDWLAAWKTFYAGRSVPKPVALIEYSYGPAWLITEKE